MATEKNKEIVQRHIDEIVNNGRSELIPDLYAQDVVYFDPFTPGGRGDGIKSITDFIVATKNAFPDFRFTVDTVFAEGDTVAWRGSADGTFKGAFPGLPPPNGNTIRIPMCQIFKFRDGKIVELHVFTDSLGLAQQVGALG